MSQKIKCTPKDLEPSVTDAISKLFIGVHKTYGTISGDVTPEQVVALEQITDLLCELLSEQVNQNL